MGEIQEVDESFLLTAQKMAKFAEDSRFYDNLLRLGEGKYIFKVARSAQSDTPPGTQAVPSVEPRLTITGDADEVLDYTIAQDTVNFYYGDVDEEEQAYDIVDVVQVV